MLGILLTLLAALVGLCCALIDATAGSPSNKTGRYARAYRIDVWGRLYNLPVKSIGRGAVSSKN